ncbi:MAG: hypothetical protein E3J35_02395 [Methanomassiliicoccales archaeon]|nr:MAG: hypothetical protein E3J35_02395 [Methanomassiliicoccales archaeon]
MTTKKFKYQLKHDPEKLFGILKAKADEKGWNLDGNAKSGSFSGGPLGLVSGEYEVRGNTVYVTVHCGISSAWGKIKKELDDFFG